MTTPANTPESSRLKRTAKGGALITVGLVAGLAASQIEQIGSVLRNLSGNGIAPETSASTPGNAPEGAPNAPHPLQGDANRLLSELHQYLNSQSVTAADCDREIERAIADANNPQKTENVARWQRVKSFVGLDTELKRIVEALLQPGANIDALLTEADSLLNPHRLTAEQVTAAQAECVARGDLQAMAMAEEWAVHARLLQHLEAVRVFAGKVRTGRRS